MDDELVKLIIAVLIPFWEVVRWLINRYRTR